MADQLGEELFQLLLLRRWLRDLAPGLTPRSVLEKFTTTLPTEVADEAGLLRRVNRATTVRLYPVLPGETALLYEMGIPVVEKLDGSEIISEKEVFGSRPGAETS